MRVYIEKAIDGVRYVTVAPARVAQLAPVQVQVQPEDDFAAIVGTLVNDVDGRERAARLRRQPG